MIMSQLFKFLFGKDLDLESPFLSLYDRLKLINPRNKGAFISQSGNLPLDAKPHEVVVSPSGGGKTTSVIVPNLLSMTPEKGSAVVFDPGSDVYRLTAGYLQQAGFEIKVIDFEHHDLSERFNPLHRASDDMAIQKVASVLVDVNYQNGSSSDPFWSDSAKHVLRLLIQALMSKKQKEKPKTLTTLYELLNMFGTEQQELDEFMILNLPEKAQLEYMAMMESTTEKVQQTILSVCKTALSKVTTLETLISEETLHFESIRKIPTVLFVRIQENQIPYYSFIISLYYVQLLDMLMILPKGKETYLPVTILADEFTSYKVPNVENLITVLRRRKVHLVIVLQSLSQLEVYGKHSAETIISNCSTIVVFPGVGQSTASKIEQMLGTYEREGRQEKVMSSREIRMMKEHQVLFIHSNLPPSVIKLLPWYKVRRFKKRANLPIQEKGGSS
jgi:type IV secretion system protein VirD4